MPFGRKKQVAQAPVAQQQGIGRSGRVAGAIESRSEPLYDTVVLTGAVSAQQKRLFSSPLGGSVDETVTNMTNAAILPFPQAHLVRAIRVEAITTDAADWEFLPKLLRNCVLKFTVGTKDYLEVPLSQCAGKVSAVLSGGKNDGTQARQISQCGASAQNGFKMNLDKFIKIGPNENFAVDLVIGSGMSHTLNSPVKVRVYLDGTRYIEVR